jgi:peptide/nickel transport system ATP-binding protein
VTAILSAHGVTKRYGTFTALDNVSFELERGTTIGVVGESGSGKSTLGRIAMRLLQPDDGTVLLDHRKVMADEEDRDAET